MLRFARPMPFLAALTIVGPAAGRAQLTAITDVTVIEVAAGRAVPDQTVLIEGRRIARIGPARETAVPAGATVVPGRGRWLVPGLWDMHVHLSVPGGEALLGLFLANGVTGVRDMNDSFPEIVGWRRRIAAGELAGPRIVASGPYLVGGRPPLPHYLVRTPAEAQAGVDSLRALGVDFVKVHNAIPREAYFAVAARVKALGWSYAGHVPEGVSVAEAADAGQRSLEHLARFSSRCTPEEAAGLTPTGLVTFLLGPCDQTDLSATVARLRANPVWVTPTLVVQRSLFGGTAGDSTDRYRSEGLRRLQSVVMRIPPMSPEAIATARVLFRKRQELVGALHRAGVAFLVGTDVPGPGTFTGFSIHDELALLVESGLSPAAALRAATLEPARYLAAEDSLGTVAPGRVADLVLLDADPLADIGATRRIAAVWTAGRMIDAEGRRRLLDRAAEAARAP